MRLTSHLKTIYSLLPAYWNASDWQVVLLRIVHLRIVLLRKSLLRNRAFEMWLRHGAPGRSRTCYLPLRRGSLYPSELQALWAVFSDRIDVTENVILTGKGKKNKP